MIDVQSGFKMLTGSEQNFSNRAIKRKTLFLILSITGIIVGLSLAVFYIWKAKTQPDFDMGPHFVIVILILLAARLNLRQYRYATILEKLISGNGASIKTERDST
jgi:hypothetical protein